MAEFDLTAARVARSPEPKKLVLRNTEDDSIAAEYQLVPELPASAVENAAAGKTAAALRELFIDEDDAEQFMATKPSTEDLAAIMRGLYGLRGLD